MELTSIAQQIINEKVFDRRLQKMLELASQAPPGLLQTHDDLLAWQHSASRDPMSYTGFNPPLPAAPCVAPCGSARKIEVLRERMANGEHLWHPQDVNTFEFISRE